MFHHPNPRFANRPGEQDRSRSANQLIRAGWVNHARKQAGPGFGPMNFKYNPDENYHQIIQKSTISQKLHI